MRRLVERSRDRLLIRLSRYDPRSTWFAVARSLLALATFSILVTTPDSALFPYLPGQPEGPRCAGIRTLSIWCVAGPDPAALAVARAVSIAVLLAVAAGYRPRWTCVPHWYVTFSLGVSMYLPNGGDQAARLITLLLIPLCLGDTRAWQWRAPSTPLAPRVRGVAYAAFLVIRVQVAIIYGHAALAKLSESVWRDGTALHYALQDAYYGAPATLRLVESVPWLSPALTWGAVLIEAAIAIAVLGPAAARRAALVAGILFHVGIAAVLGLFSFGLVMIAVLLIACAPAKPAVRGSLQESGNSPAARSE